MNKTVELVNEWGNFEKEHPDAHILDFCRYMLGKQTENAGKENYLGGAIPPDHFSQVAKMLGRISKIHASVALPLLKKHGINSFEDFAFLNTIYRMGQPRKIDVINSNFVELSSGLLILERLKKSRWIDEKTDDNDKRSKRLNILPKGKEVLEQVYKHMAVLNQQCFGVVPADDLALCVLLLGPVEAAMAELWLKTKKG